MTNPTRTTREAQAGTTLANFVEAVEDAAAEAILLAHTRIERTARITFEPRTRSFYRTVAGGPEFEISRATVLDMLADPEWESHVD